MDPGLVDAGAVDRGLIEDAAAADLGGAGDDGFGDRDRLRVPGPGGGPAGRPAAVHRCPDDAVAGDRPGAGTAGGRIDEAGRFLRLVPFPAGAALGVSVR